MYSVFIPSKNTKQILASLEWKQQEFVINVLFIIFSNASVNGQTFRASFATQKYFFFNCLISVLTYFVLYFQ